ELHLRERRRLIVEAAQGPPAMVERGAALGERGVETLLREVLRAPGAGEEAALVDVLLLLDDIDAGESGRSIAQRRRSLGRLRVSRGSGPRVWARRTFLPTP